MVSAAKRRRRRSRKGERGSTIFIVLTVIAILSAIGAYALSNARYEIKTAGYIRQRNVAEQVAGLGAQAATSELGSAPAAYIGRMRMTTEKCVNNADLDKVMATSSGATGTLFPPCYHIYLQDVQNRTGATLFTLATVPAPPATGTPGSLGLTLMNGGFWVELTDPIEIVRPIAGAPIDGSPGTPKFIDVTVTSNGVVFQEDPTSINGIVDPAERPGATFTTGRGHVVVGPIYGSI